MNTEMDPIVRELLVFLISFCVIPLIIGIAMKIHTFSRELDYINREIGRTNGGEQKYWKREKRRLWLSLLLFCRS